MNKKILTKVVSIALVCVMLVVTCGIYFMNINVANADDGTIYLVENKDGTYGKIPITRSIFSKKSIAVTSADGEVFVNNENMYRKVNETVYIPTQEVFVNLQSATLESDLIEMGMLKIARDNIMKHKLISEENDTDLEVKIYAPSSRATRIYTGWNHNQYYENYYTITFQSEPLELESNLTEAKLTRMTEAIVSTVVNGLADYKTFGLYSLGTAIFGANSLPDRFSNKRTMINVDVTETHKDTYLYDTDYINPYIFGSSFVWLNSGKIEKDIEIPGGDDYYAAPEYIEMEKDPLWYEADKTVCDYRALGGYRQLYKYTYKYNGDVYRFN